MRDLRERRAFRKHERKDQIESAVAAGMIMSTRGLSMRQIARKLDMRPSTHLMDILIEMASEGRLDYRVLPYRSKGIGAERFVFFIPPKRMATALANVYGE